MGGFGDNFTNLICYRYARSLDESGGSILLVNCDENLIINYFFEVWRFPLGAFFFQGKEQDLCKVATQAEEALGEVDLVLSSSSLPSSSSTMSSSSLSKSQNHHIITNTITITKMVETVEELMIAVLGGSAEIIGWPGKVVLCAAEVSISIRISTGFFYLSDPKKNFCLRKYVH